jgi:hypothetical protein
MSTYRTVDKSAWGPGPWQDEPDEVSWTDDATGLACLIMRSPFSGGLCGYVGVGPDHRWYGLNKSDCLDEGCDSLLCPRMLDVHGGITFSGVRSADALTPGNTSAVWLWYFGFDCFHEDDYGPKVAAQDLSWAEITKQNTYRDISYVRGECSGLAAQLAGVTN